MSAHARAIEYEPSWLVSTEHHEHGTPVGKALGYIIRGLN